MLPFTMELRTPPSMSCIVFFRARHSPSLNRKYLTQPNCSVVHKSSKAHKVHAGIEKYIDAPGSQGAAEWPLPDLGHQPEVGVEVRGRGNWSGFKTKG